MFKIKFAAILVLLILSNILIGQSNDVNKYKLRVGNDSIDYIIIGDTTRGNLPALVYCTGSLPHPLFIEMEKGIKCTLPFDYQKIIKYCYIVVLSKKGVPIFAKKK